VKLRSTRSGRRRAAGSGRVVFQNLPRRLAPQIPLALISRSTVQRATGSPARFSAIHTRRLVIGRGRHLQGPADRLDPEMTATLVDERGHFGRSGSSSFAETTDADFKLSFARRSSKFS